MDIDAALEATEETMSVFWPLVAWPTAAPFSGGVLDAWPARLTEEIAICRSEWAVIQDFVREELRHGGH